MSAEAEIDQKHRTGGAEHLCVIHQDLGAGKLGQVKREVGKAKSQQLFQKLEVLSTGENIREKPVSEMESKIGTKNPQPALFHLTH